MSVELDQGDQTMTTRRVKKSPAPKAKKPARSAEDWVPGAGAMTDALDRATSVFKSAAGQLADWVGPATEITLGLGRAAIKDPRQRRALEKAGSLLRDAREAAGLTLADLGAAINLKDQSILDMVESGKVALPFEIALRVAGVVARNDPIPFVMQLTRNYNPSLWSALDTLGIGRVTAYAVREREFINILRSRDKARKLTEAEFEHVLKFTAAAFDLSVDLVAELKSKTKST
jgi:transcriptional regulator with XRE-family HTH domain